MPARFARHSAYDARIAYADELVGQLTAFLKKRGLYNGGILVLTSPYTWLESFTKKEEWLGGYREAGEPVTTLKGLSAVLSPHFRMVGEPRDVPFVIRETRRKFQHTVAELTVWELK